MTVRRYAVLDGEDVVNVILLDANDEYEPEDGTTLRLSSSAGIGWKRVNNAWVPPVNPEVDPETEEPIV